jgi:hypothetical protein
MRKTIFSVLGILVIAASTVQMASAAPRTARKAAHVPAPATQQFRDSFDSANGPVRSKSCDIVWCYEN